MPPKFVWLVFLVTMLAGCVTTPPLQIDCRTTAFRLDADFVAGAMAGCRVIDEQHIEIVIRPEDRPINPSPWYAVRLTPEQSGPVTVTLLYPDAAHRYRPKLIGPGGGWRYVPDQQVTVFDEGRRVSVEIGLDAEPVFLAGQELLTPADYRAWLESHARSQNVSLAQIGRSIEERPIQMLTTTTANAAGTVVLVGRQHPPELTGALAMLPFVDEVLGDTELARRFRQRFNTAVVPLMNPDGVTHGHWRHNLASTDLNRDWGPFRQPESQAVLRVLDRLALTPQESPVVFLDFHSTRRNVFYTQPIGADGTDYRFTAKWLAQSRARLVDYSFERAERPQSALATSKNYVHGRFGIPAITYEVGDETDRVALTNAARIFAQEMMRVLLAEHSSP